MKVMFDPKSDTLTIIFTDATVLESDEEKPGFIIDYDANGNLVAIEILDASQRVELPSRIEYQVTPSAV